MRELKLPLAIAIVQAGLTVFFISRELDGGTLRPLTVSRTILIAVLLVLPLAWLYPFLRYLEHMPVREAMKVVLIVAVITAYMVLRIGLLR